MERVAIVAVESIALSVIDEVVRRWKKRSLERDGGILLLVADRNEAELHVSLLAKKLGLPCEVVDVKQLAKECTDVVALWDGRDVDVATVVSDALRIRRKVFLYYAESMVWYTQARLVGMMVREAIRVHRTVGNTMWNDRLIDPAGRGYRRMVSRRGSS